MARLECRSRFHMPDFVGRRIRELVGVAVAVTAVTACSSAYAQVPETPRVTLPETPVTQPVQDVADEATNTANQVTGQVNQTVNPSGTNNPPSGGDGGGGGTGGGGGGGAPATGGGDDSTGSGGSDDDGGSGGGSAATSREAAAERRAERRERRTAARRAAERRERAAARRGGGGEGRSGGEGGGTGPLQPIRDVVEVIPTPMWVATGLLALLAGMFFARAALVGRRASRLEAQRSELLDDVGLLQKALLPDVPTRIGALEASVAYRPAEGPAAGGDFYDVFEMDHHRVGIIVGDVCGHGRQALAVTALMRYTLRAYLNAGGEPRAALQLAASALENEPHAELTTVVLAVYDGDAGTLTYACAGHEPPIIVGPSGHRPVTIGSSPPVGAGLTTGLRQTTVSLPPGSLACFFTDGLVEARLHGDDQLGRERLTAMVEGMGLEASADTLLARIADTVERSTDDMAACMVRAGANAPRNGQVRIEELELDDNGAGEDRARGFLAACGVPEPEAETVVTTALAARSEFGGAMLRVRLAADGGGVKVVPLELRSLTASTNGSKPHAAVPAAPPISA
jgi:hypothetical protein